MQRIRRGFVTVNGRQVHYRTAGSGPPVVLVHQSPISSKSLEMQTAAYGEHFTAIAVDIPGLGLSDPLLCRAPTAEDFAIALAETLDALGIGRTALFGSHTGATICVEFARRFPERTVQVLLDGYPIYTTGEQARRLATYFDWVGPRWDGGHLLWLWARFREQYLFYPWNAPGRGTRADCDVPSVEFIHDGAVDLLTAGPDYTRVYSAAYTYDAPQRIREVTVPVRFMVYRDDSLARAHALLEGLPSCCEIVPMPDDRTVGVGKEIEMLRSAPSPGAAPHLPGTVAKTGGITRRYLDVDGGQLMLFEVGSSEDRPIVVLPPAPGSATLMLNRLLLLARHRRVLAIDLPSCGGSDRFANHERSVVALTDPVEAALTQMGFGKDVDLYGVNGGALMALELLRRGSGNKAVAEGVPYFASVAAPDLERYAPPIELQADGTHWIKMWHAVRSEQLFWPWYDQRESGIRAIDPLLNPARLTEKVLAYMRQPQSYASVYRAVLGRPSSETAAAVSDKVTLMAGEDDVFAQTTETLANDTGRPFVGLTRSESENIAAIEKALLP